MRPCRQFAANLWVGASSGSLHYDEYDNALLQLRGTKRIILYPVQYSSRLHLNSILSRHPNHSKFNNEFLTEATLKAHPELKNVPGSLAHGTTHTHKHTRARTGTHTHARTHTRQNTKQQVHYPPHAHS
jgi:hypothetical protein